MSDIADIVLQDLIDMARDDKRTLEFMVEEWMKNWTEDEIRQQYIDLNWGTKRYDIGDESW